MSNNLGKTIKEARIAKGMTQGQLAILSGITQTQISNIETGRTKRPQLLTLHSLNEYLGLEEVMEQTREQSYFIGKKIEELRVNKRLSQRQLANLSGVSEIQIRNIEQGKTKKPRLRTIELLDEALDHELSKKDK